MSLTLRASPSDEDIDCASDSEPANPLPSLRVENAAVVHPVARKSCGGRLHPNRLIKAEVTESKAAILSGAILKNADNYLTCKICPKTIRIGISVNGVSVHALNVDLSGSPNPNININFSTEDSSDTGLLRGRDSKSGSSRPSNSDVNKAKSNTGYLIDCQQQGKSKCEVGLSDSSKDVKVKDKTEETVAEPKGKPGFGKEFSYEAVVKQPCSYVSFSPDSSQLLEHDPRDLRTHLDTLRSKRKQVFPPYTADAEDTKVIGFKVEGSSDCLDQAFAPTKPNLHKRPRVIGTKPVKRNMPIPSAPELTPSSLAFKWDESSSSDSSVEELEFIRALKDVEMVDLAYSSESDSIGG